MTREERELAIKELQGCIIAEEHGKDGKPNGNVTCELTRDTIDLAIKTLEQDSTTKNDLGVDCISRQSVLDKIQRLINAEQNNIDENGDYMNYARERVNSYEAIQFFVENDCLCPSVTPQELCDKCEVGNPCLYCKHEFEPQKSEVEDGNNTK